MRARKTGGKNNRKNESEINQADWFVFLFQLETSEFEAVLEAILNILKRWLFSSIDDNKRIQNVLQRIFFICGKSPFPRIFFPFSAPRNIRLAKILP